MSPYEGVWMSDPMLIFDQIFDLAVPRAERARKKVVLAISRTWSGYEVTARRGIRSASFFFTDRQLRQCLDPSEFVGEVAVRIQQIYACVASEAA